MGGNWQNQVRRIAPHDAVAAGNVNRPINDLTSRTQQLKDRLDSRENSQSLVAWDQPIEASTLPGQAVFWNAETQQWELALAGVTVDSTTGACMATADSNCQGIVLSKPAAKVAHIVLSGLVPTSSLTNAIDGEVLPGRYYLSAAAPGKLVQQRPAVGVYIGTVFGPLNNCDDTTYMLVSPQMRDFQFDHIHYRIALVCRPAGATTPPAEGFAHAITDADVALQGWLPADHESFADKAPPGAAFGYNLAAHPALSRLWPPIPLNAVAVLWDKGVDHVGATEVPLGRDGLVVCDTNGIWWMSDCYGDVPWLTTLDTSSSYSVGSESLECPRTETMRLDVVFLRTLFGADRTVVTSLAPDTDSPLYFHNCDGDDATTGDLKAGINLIASIEEDVNGSLAFKGVDNKLQFKRGPIVEGVKSGSANLVITSTLPRLEDPEDESSDTIHQGIVTIDASSLLDERELSPQIVRLGDAVERTFREMPYIGFPKDRTSSVVARINVPQTGLPNNPVVKFRVTLLAFAAGTLPLLSCGYRIVPRPDGFTTPSSVPATATAIDFESDQDVAVYDVIEIESESFPVNAGDTIGISLSRTSSDSFSGEVGILRMACVLSGD